MKNKKIVGMIVIVLLVAGLSFLGGMKYGSSKSSANQLTSRQSQFGQNGFNQNVGGRTGQGMRNGGGFGEGVVSGEILSKDATSMTVSLRSGGSKIVLYSPTTKVEKTVDGTIADVIAGKSVMITGTANPDGSVSASSIQIRPTLSIPLPTKTN